jgi:hypothetical protein
MVKVVEQLRTSNVTKPIVLNLPNQNIQDINENNTTTIMSKTVTVTPVGGTPEVRTYSLARYIDSTIEPSKQLYTETYLYYYTTTPATQTKYVYILQIETDLKDPTAQLTQLAVTGRYCMKIPHSQKMNFQELWNPVVNEKWIFNVNAEFTQLSATPV